MRRTCQIYDGGKICGEPAVDFVELYGSDLSNRGEDWDDEDLVARISMCAFHWDEYHSTDVLSDFEGNE